MAEPAPTAVVLEKVDSRVVDAGTLQIQAKYIVKDTTDDAAVLAALIAEAPTTWSCNGIVLARTGISFEPEFVDTVNEQGIWNATVTYTLPNYIQRLAGTSTMRLVLGSASEHITQSKGTARYGSNAPDCQNAIAVTNGQVNGVDIDAKAFGIEFTMYIAEGLINQTYLFRLYGLCPAVNNAPVTLDPSDGPALTFAAGELKLKGVNGGPRGDGVWELTFSFEASPNLTGQSIGGITGISKLGWQYLWVLYQDANVNNMTLPQPQAVYVETVYDSATINIRP